MKAIETKYLGPTDSNNSRIKAECARGKITISYDYGLTVCENHRAAAQALCEVFEASDKAEYGVDCSSWAWWGGECITGELKNSYVHVFAK